jgi:hypothetical protein
VTLTVTALIVSGTAYALTRTSAVPAIGVPTAKPPCSIKVGDETVDWSVERAMTLTTVAGVGMRRKADERHVAAAVRRALRIAGAQPLDARAVRAIYLGLPERPRAGRSATRLARALLGYGGSALSCSAESVRLGGLGGLYAPDADLDRETPGPTGLTPRADTARAAMRAVFGRQILGGFAPEGVAGGHIDGSPHYEGRAIDVFFRPVSEANRRAGWTQAQWAVAHAASLNIATVIFDARIWSSRRSVSGWRDYEHPGGPTDNAILLHRDHVHVDVAEGA